MPFFTGLIYRSLKKKTKNKNMIVSSMALARGNSTLILKEVSILRGLLKVILWYTAQLIQQFHF